MAFIIRQVIGKRAAASPLFRHDPHFEGRSAGWKAVPVYRQPVALGEVEEHRRIATCGDDPPGRGIRLEPMLLKIFLPRRTLHAILAIEDVVRSAVGIEDATARKAVVRTGVRLPGSSRNSRRPPESAGRPPPISPCRIGISRTGVCAVADSLRPPFRGALPMSLFWRLIRDVRKGLPADPRSSSASAVASFPAQRPRGLRAVAPIGQDEGCGPDSPS